MERRFYRTRQYLGLHVIGRGPAFEVQLWLDRIAEVPHMRMPGYNPGYNAAAMIAKDLLDILVCPACKQGLDYRQSPESLKCVGCHRVYAVKDNIPIMLVDEATIEP